MIYAALQECISILEHQVIVHQLLDLVVVNGAHHTRRPVVHADIKGVLALDVSNLSKLQRHVKPVAQVLNHFALLLVFLHGLVHRVRADAKLHAVLQVGRPQGLLSEDGGLTPDEHAAAFCRLRMGHGGVDICACDLDKLGRPRAKRCEDKRGVELQVGGVETHLGIEEHLYHFDITGGRSHV